METNRRRLPYEALCNWDVQLGGWYRHHRRAKGTEETASHGQIKQRRGSLETAEQTIFCSSFFFDNYHLNGHKSALPKRRQNSVVLFGRWLNLAAEGAHAQLLSHNAMNGLSMKRWIIYGPKLTFAGLDCVSIWRWTRHRCEFDMVHVWPSPSGAAVGWCMLLVACRVLSGEATAPPPRDPIVVANWRRQKHSTELTFQYVLTLNCNSAQILIFSGYLCSVTVFMYEPSLILNGQFFVHSFVVWTQYIYDNKKVMGMSFGPICGQWARGGNPL